MKILVTTPCFAPHGGIRIILELANRLADHHEVFLQNLGLDANRHLKIDPRVKVLPHDAWKSARPDLWLLTSPHATPLLERPGKKLLHLQMLEHLFRPNDAAWRRQCKAFYTAKYPLISISKWNIAALKKDYWRKDDNTFFMGTGVNTLQFPVEACPKDGKTVLVEGWAVGNPTKDSSRLAPKVARRLKAEGYRILAYGLLPPADFADVPDEFHVKPDLATMNWLYREATILLKASVYDARSCSPMEAMTKGTVTARALRLGDEDLIHDVNCLRSDYCGAGAELTLYRNARCLLVNEKLHTRLLYGCYEHVKTQSWEHWLPQYLELIKNL